MNKRGRARRRNAGAGRTAGAVGLVRGLGRHAGGQSLAEFALILPFFLLLLAGVTEFSNAWRTFQVITNVAREGVRLAVIPTSDEVQVRQAVTGGLTRAGLDTARATLSLQLCSGGSCTGTADTVRIDYSYSFTFVGPLLSLACQGDGCSAPPGTITISSSSTMRNE